MTYRKRKFFVHLIVNFNEIQHRDQSVNSSLSCGPVEKTRALYLSRFSRGGPTKSSSKNPNLKILIFFASTRDQRESRKSLGLDNFCRVSESLGLKKP